jgi:uncharacterized protein
MLNTLPDRIIGFSMRHARVVVVATFVVSLVFAWFATKVRINADFTSLLPQNAEVNKLLKEYGGAGAPADLLVFAATARPGADIFSPEPLSAYAQAVSNISALPGVRSTVSPFNLVSFSREEGRLGIHPMSTGGAAPSPGSEGEFRSRLTGTRYASNLVVSADATMLISYFQASHEASFDSFMAKVNAVAAQAKAHGLVTYVTGTIPVSVQAGSYLVRDLERLIVLAALIILLFYAVGYRSVRGVILPLLSVLLGTLWTVGFMGLMGYTLSLISVVAPPLILIFGNEYNIYMTSEVVRIGREEGASPGWMERASRNVAKPITMAFLTTVVGFLSLCVTEIRQTREFAFATGFGSLACAFLALFFLPAMFSLMRAPVRRQPRLGKAFAQAMRALARLAAAFPVVVFAILAATIVLFALTYRLLIFNTDSGSYFPRKDSVMRDTYSIYAKAGGFEQLSVAFNAPPGRPGYFLDTRVLADVANVEAKLRALPDVSYALSLPDLLREVNRAATGEDVLPANRAIITMFSRVLTSTASSIAGGTMLGNLVNADFTRLNVSFRIYNAATGRYMDEASFRALLGSMQRVLNENPVGGTAVIWGDLMRVLSFADSLRRSLFFSMAISVASILALTVFVFRSFLYGLYALVPLGAGLLLNFTMMALTGIPLDMTTIMVSNIAIGVGVDSAIYLVIQYRRHLASMPANPGEALQQTLAVMGQPILLSSLSIVVGLSVFATAEFLPVLYFGVLVLFTLLATTAGTLVTLPTLLSVDTRLRLRRAVRRGGPSVSP